jgi:hypothetical protein
MKYSTAMSVKREPPISDPKTREDDLLASIEVQSPPTKRRRSEKTRDSSYVPNRQGSLELAGPSHDDNSGTQKSTDPIDDDSGIWTGRLRGKKFDFTWPEFDFDSSEEEEETIPYDEVDDETGSTMSIDEEACPHQELNSALSKLKTTISRLEKAHFGILWTEQTSFLKLNLSNYLAEGLASIKGQLRRSFWNETGILRKRH